MKTVAVASCKGGSGKTTTTVTLAWRAACDFGKVAMIDMNEDQGTLTAWWQLRGRTVNPYLLKDPGDLESDIKVLASEGFQVCFIDTPPMDMELIEIAVVLADAVVVPVMPAYFDTAAVDAVVDMCKRRKKPYRFLWSAYDKRATFDAVNREALAALKGRGDIFAAKLSYDPGYRLGQIDGKAGPEKVKRLQPEVDALWDEVRALAKIDAPASAPPKLTIVKEVKAAKGGKRG